MYLCPHIYYRLFERALEICGFEFRSDKLWDKYIDWEAKNEEYVNITQIYKRLLTTPTKCFSTHFDKYVFVSVCVFVLHQ